MTPSPEKHSRTTEIRHDAEFGTFELWCFVNHGETYISRRVYKTRAGAERAAARHMAGLYVGTR